MLSLPQQWLGSWDATLVVHFLPTLMHGDSIFRMFWSVMSLPNFKIFPSSSTLICLSLDQTVLKLSGNK